MEHCGRELDSWVELLEKAISAEAKAGPWPASNLREIDDRCPIGTGPAHTAVAQSRATTRDPREEKAT